jgi:hypothetical protein
MLRCAALFLHLMEKLNKPKPFLKIGVITLNF